MGEWRDDLDPSELARRRTLLRDPGVVVHRDSVYTQLEAGLAAEFARRLTGRDAELRACVLSGSFLATLRVALHHWIDNPAVNTPRCDRLEVGGCAVTLVRAGFSRQPHPRRRRPARR